MKRLILLSGFLVLFLITFSSNAFCQKGDSLKDRDWRIEVEPASFVFHGFNLHISRNITMDNKLNVGLYFLSLDIPEKVHKGMFNNLNDTVDVRLGFEAAIITRYKFNLWKNHETNPYIGLITGWEYFDITQPSVSKLRIATGVVTPFAGYEIYFFRQMLFVNPQLRGVIYIAPKNNRAGVESIKPFFLLPAVSVGIRL